MYVLFPNPKDTEVSFHNLQVTHCVISQPQEYHASFPNPQYTHWGGVEVDDCILQVIFLLLQDGVVVDEEDLLPRQPGTGKGEVVIAFN